MASITSRHDDWQLSLHREPKQGQNNPSLKYYSEQKQKSTRTNRPDPPECFTIQQPPRHSHKEHPSKPQQPSSQNQTHPTKQRDRANLQLLSHEQKTTKTKRHHSSSNKHQKVHQQRKQEGQRSHLAREHVIDTEGKTPPRRRKSRKSQESSPTASQRRRAEDRHCYPEKSTSFQSHPWQFLQIYKDLRQKQLDPEISRREGGVINENYDENSTSGGSCTSSPGCLEFSILESCSENRIQTSSSQNDNSEDDGEEFSIDGSDTTSLTVLHDENNDHDDYSYECTSQKGNNAYTSKTTFPNQHPEKGHIRIRTFDKQGSMGGGSTSAAATSATLEAMHIMGAGDLEKQRQQKQQRRCIIPSDHSNNKDDYFAIVAAAAPANTRGENILQASVGALTTSRSRANSHPLSRSIQSSPFLLPIDYQLLQQQIEYLKQPEEKNSITAKHDGEDNNGDPPPPSSSQLIIYPHYHHPTTLEACFKEIRRRREIIHNRSGIKTNYSSPAHRSGRRWSFS